MSSTRRKQNNPTKSASDIKKKEKASKPSKNALKSEPDESSLARSRPQRKIIPKRPLSPDIELSSRRKKRRKKKAPPANKSVNIVSTHAVHIPPGEIKAPKLNKEQKASLKIKKKKRKKKTFVFPILASDRVPKEPDSRPRTVADDGGTGLAKMPEVAPIRKKKHISRNVLDVDLLRMLPAAELVKRFAKHTSFKVPTEEFRAPLKQHVYTCKMLPHFCTEKFYGNDEDTRRQITKHLLRHVGELLTVTNRGINMMSPSSKKQKKKGKKESKKEAKKEGANSTMYILPSAPRPMRVTLPKNVSSRMKRSSYTVIRSADGTEKGINEVVLLPKGRLVSIMNAPTKNYNEDPMMDMQDSIPGGDGVDTRRERVVVKKGDGILEGTATKVGINPAVDVAACMPALSIESLAEAVEAMVDKESQGLNIQAAEALAKAANLDGLGTSTAPMSNEFYPSQIFNSVNQPIKSERTSPTLSTSSSSSSSSGSLSSSSSWPSEQMSKSTMKVKKVSKISKHKDNPKKKKKKKKKKTTNFISSFIPHAVDPPHPDHNYAFSNNRDLHSPLHCDSEGIPTDPPPSIEETEPDGLDMDTLASSTNDQLNQLIADIDTPSSTPVPRVSNENEEPVIAEGAYVTVEHEEFIMKKSKKSKIKGKPKVSIVNEDVKQVALYHLQSLAKVRKRKGPFTCEICLKVLTAASTLRAHYRSHAGIKPYQCEICQATFTRLHSLKYHTMIHNKEARFLCSYCQRQFRHSSHYREHLRRHTGEEPFGCSDCSARFKTRNTYKRHLRSKHGKVVAEDGKINMAPTDMFSPAFLSKTH